MPIIPMLLVNGSDGIGTGFSCSCPSYNPKTIMEYIRRKTLNQDVDYIDFVPYYEGYKGTVTRVSDSKFICKGVYRMVGNDKVVITEPCIGVSFEKYKTYLNKLEEEKLIKGHKTNLNDVSFESTVTFNSAEDLEKLMNNVVASKGSASANACEDDGSVSSVAGGEVSALEKLLKLHVAISTNNLYAWNSEGKLVKYDDPEHIIDEFYEVRYKGYVERKKCMLAQLLEELKFLTNRVKYIQETLNGTIDLRKKKEAEVTELLKSMGFDMISSGSGSVANYHYLVKMPMDSVTEEYVDKMIKQYRAKKDEYDTLVRTTEGEMWRNDLDELEVQYDAYLKRRAQSTK
jgi:DNA topoisomerase-2